VKVAGSTSGGNVEREEVGSIVLERILGVMILDDVVGLLSIFDDVGEVTDGDDVVGLLSVSDDGEREVASMGEDS
jgi:hypothetical protein